MVEAQIKMKDILTNRTGLPPRCQEQLIELGSKGDASSGGRDEVIERLDSRVVPGKEQPPRPPVPPRERKHSIQARQHIGPPQGQGFEKNFRIAMRPKTNALDLQLTAKVGEVVDLPVQDDDGSRIRRDHGLVASRRPVSYTHLTL